MPNYEDPPEDYLCPICKDESCEGCPGAERWDDEPQSIWDEPEKDDLTREDYAIIEADIFAEREEEERSGH